VPHDVSGWQPDWTSHTQALSARHRDRLRRLRGQRIDATWLVWIVDTYKWFADLPVVLRIGDQQLEVCARNFDDLSITWNTIDVQVPPRAWMDGALQWRRDAHPVLRQAVGRIVREVRMTEHLFTTERVHPPDPDRQHTESSWLLGGIWLELDGGHLQIYNALDENGLTDQPPSTGPNFRVVTP
jgi:hypothetical protein